MCLLLLLQYHLQHPSFPLLNCNKIRSLSLQSKPRIDYHQQMGSTLEAPFLIWALLLFLLRRSGLLLCLFGLLRQLLRQLLSRRVHACPQPPHFSNGAVKLHAAPGSRCCRGLDACWGFTMCSQLIRCWNRRN